MTCLQTKLKQICDCTDRLVVNVSEPRCSAVNKTQGIHITGTEMRSFLFKTKQNKNDTDILL